MKRHIPNAITSLNLFSGSVGVVASLSGYWYLAFWMMIVASIFDFFDGMTARLLNVSSPIGKELDSLADMVSFGFLPAVIMFSMLSNSYNLPLLRFQGFLFIPYFAFFIAIMSAIRLAKFNLDVRQNENFIGLPTPANALFIGGLSLITHFLCHCSPISHFIGNAYTLLALTFIFSILLVVELPLLSLKFKNLNFRDNLWRYLLVFGSIIIAITFVYWIYMAVSIIILYYIFLSIVWNMFKSKQ